MIYLTWSTGYSGVFASQVIDVLYNFNSIGPCDIKLVCFVPYHGFFKTRKAILNNYENSIVIPMIPSRNRWWALYTPLLCAVSFLCGETKIMARGVIACNLALLLKKKGLIKWICYDGRGAEKAEWNEYNIVNDNFLEKKISQLENDAVNKSDFRLGVSHKLIEYWRRDFDYCSFKHVVIPCTVNKIFFKEALSSSVILMRRQELGFDKEDVVIAFSGGIDHWQSFSELDLLLKKLFSLSLKVKILFLSNLDLERLTAYHLYKERFSQKWVSPAEVPKYLSICDYGLLYRHNSVTNQVASPTKFAEYLSCGLQVIISSDVGDYSSLVAQENLGIVVSDINQSLQLSKAYLDDKERISNYGSMNFTKEAYKVQYKQILDNAALQG